MPRLPDKEALGNAPAISRKLFVAMRFVFAEKCAVCADFNSAVFAEQFELLSVPRAGERRYAGGG